MRRDRRSCRRRCCIGQASSELKTGDRFAAARRFAIEAAQLAANTRCHDVVVQDFSGLMPVCDFFVIATGTSPRQLRSVAEEIAELGKSREFAPINPVHQDSSSWILVDCVDVVIHLFSEEGRRYYDLENLWGDAKRVDWNDAATSSKSKSK